MRFAIVLTVLVVCGNVQGQTSAAASVDHVQKLEGLNSEQQKAVDDYIRKIEKPTGEIRTITDRNNIKVLSSQALRTLFPGYRFVAVMWKYEADSNVLNKYSIPGPTLHTLVLDENGRNCMPNRTGYLEEYADLLRAEKIKVTDDTSAALVKSALIDIYGFGMSLTNLRRGNSEWLLGYQEWPFRAVSSYEEIREASYYLLSVDKNGFVVSGRLVHEVLERRAIH